MRVNKEIPKIFIPGVTSETQPSAGRFPLSLGSCLLMCSFDNGNFLRMSKAVELRFYLFQ
jgi:hypothetical protein